MTLELKPLQEQVIVITGASSGIGLVTARRAARRGARVVLAARNASELDRAVREIREHGGRAVPVVADVAIPKTRSESRTPRSASSAGSTPGSTTPP